MKNIQVINGANNCSYDIFAVTDDEFKILFPDPGQDIEFIEDAIARVGENKLGAIMRPVWPRRVKKSDVSGIHRTIFYELFCKKRFYPNKRDDDIKR